MRLTEAGQLGLGLESAPAGPALLDRRARGTDFLKLKVTRILNPPEATGMPFWSINPYIGCEFGCAYCYARETHRWTAERNGLPIAEPPREAFERKIFVKDGVARTLRKTLDPRKVAGASIMIGTATDPYQPAERRFGVTRSVLEALLGYRNLKLRIVTKSPLVARDADLLAELARRHRVAVCFSIISLDPDLVRRLEPKTPLPHARLRGLRALADAGVEAGLLIAPIVPGLTDGWGALGGLMAAGKDAGARFADGFALRLGPVARSGFLPALAREFPDLVTRYRRRYAGRQSAGRDYVAALTKRLRTLQAVHGFPVTATATPPAERAAAARAAAAEAPAPPTPNLALSFA
ncbi:MAG: radical SAM protein [Gemmatimonadales bacterium]